MVGYLAVIHVNALSQYENQEMTFQPGIKQK